MKKFTTVQEANEIAGILQLKPEIDLRLNYYKGVLETTANHISAIDERIAQNHKYDDYEITKLKREKLDAELELHAQKKYYEQWLERSVEYKTKYEEITAECNANFDYFYEEAKKLQETNLRLRSVFGNYKTDNTDQALKNEFYLYIRQEVQNNKQFGKKPGLQKV